MHGCFAVFIAKEEIEINGDLGEERMSLEIVLERWW